MRISQSIRERFEAFAATLEPAIDLYGHCERRKEAFARIRTEIKAAQTAGLIPAFCKFSIRTDHNSLDIDLTAWEGKVFSDEYTEFLLAKYQPTGEPSKYSERDFETFNKPIDIETGRPWATPKLVPQLEDVRAFVTLIADRHNYDKSDRMADYTNVGFYLDVKISGIEAAAENALRLEADPAFAELHARAVAAFASLHPDCRYRAKIGGVEVNEWAMKGLIKMAERAKGRPLVYDKRRRGFVVDATVKVGGVEMTIVDASEVSNG